MKYLSFLFCLLLLFSCKQDRKDSSFNKVTEAKIPNLKSQSFTGKTMGTTYSIKYSIFPSQKEVTKNTIDSILVSINEGVSTYIPTSTVSRLNKAGKEGIRIKMNSYPDQHFIVNYFTSVDINKKTNGAFDPSVMPLVNYWGFGYEGKNPVTEIDSSKVKDLLNYVGMNNFTVEVKKDGISFKKKDARATLDFSAIAKGYAVDYIANHLNSKGILSYMVEIGGEVKTKGKNDNGEPWKLGVNKPEENASPTDIQVIVSPKDKALASSGNYRNYHKLNDISYGHEINPKTGFPHQTDILSASVIHESCTEADAYATAFMIMGKDRTLKFVNYNHHLEVCLIVKEKGELKEIYSEGFKEYLVNQ